jgi:hypothetical protein
MKRGISILVVLVLAYFGAQIYALSASLERVRSDDPTVWSEDIAAFASKAPGPSGALLFVGSSSIRRWTDLSEHMAPIPVINRGFGGSKSVMSSTTQRPCFKRKLLALLLSLLALMTLLPKPQNPLMQRQKLLRR